MTRRYLTDLADVLRAAGVTVIEVAGWQTRARSTGGYSDGLPTAVMIHHTASKPGSDGQRDVDYIISGSPVAPIANLYTDRKGTVWVCAAGATNTNGAGADTWGGGVPVNRMNEYAIGNEIANDGVGEPYPIAQQSAVLRSTVALCAHYGIAPSNVRAHFEWTSRKIDPSGPSAWAPSGGKWNMAAFRSDVTAALIPPIPPPNGDTMLYIAKPTYAGADAGTPWLAVFESGQIRRALNADVKYAQANGVAIIDQDSREQHEYAIAKFGI